jgi:cysteinyl-tRNA synthetase
VERPYTAGREDGGHTEHVVSFKIYNTLTRHLDEVRPLEEGHVRMYTCGPTVYDYAHIGNFRAYIFEDLLRRYLKYRGFKVTQVMNLTDVDDKTIRASREKGLPLTEYTATYVDAFFKDLEVLGIEKAEQYPAATDHIQEMIDLVATLVAKGHAYQGDDGTVYFSIKTFENYGKLARLDMSGMQSGARVAQDEYDKDNAADFALWKAWTEKDGDVAWDSPWGRGRPGWHIECSAMAMKYLGESFDIHTGGIDNMFPHHEDEIAQSEAATGKPFVRFWMHCAHLIVDGQKMSKSLGNFHTLREILAKGYSGREIRYELCATHYRQPLNFTFSGLAGARAALLRVDEFTSRLKERAGADTGDCPSWAREGQQAFEAALDDDLNVSGALAALFDMVHAGNRALDSGAVDPGGAAAALQTLGELDRVFGFLKAGDDAVDDAVMALVEARQAARTAKDWTEADRIRDELLAQGWAVKDTPQGPKLRKA